MSKFLLLVRVAPDVQPAPEDTDPTAWWEDANARGMYRDGGPLEETSDATTVSVRNGETLITDGPFAEFKEHIAGYDLIEAADMAEAIALAQGHPVTRFGTIEVREAWTDFFPPELAGEPPSAMNKPVLGRRRYLMLHVEGSPEVTPPPAEHGMAEWVTEFEARGALLGGYKLRPATEAVTVRSRGGEALVTHGPFAELAEQVGGFDVIEVSDLDEAIEVAAKHPTTSFSSIEIRPLGTM